MVVLGISAVNADCLVEVLVGLIKQLLAQKTIAAVEIAIGIILVERNCLCIIFKCFLSIATAAMAETSIVEQQAQGFWLRMAFDHVLFLNLNRLVKRLQCVFPFAILEQRKAQIVVAACLGLDGICGRTKLHNAFR